MFMLIHARKVALFAAVAIAAALVASPVLAATVWEWQTDEGTTAFTNDSKRIPAKYRKAARTRTVGKLKNYPRYTEAQVASKTPYVARVKARLQALRTAAAPAAVSAGPGMAAAHPVTIDVGTTARAGDQISIPITSGGEPIVTTTHRVRMRDSLASQQVQVTKQGDRVLAVRVSPKSHRGLEERLDAGVEAALPVAIR